MTKAYLHAHMIPMGVCDHPAYSDVQWYCFDCECDLSLRGKRSWCELQLTTSPEIVGRVCLDCAEVRTGELIDACHAIGKSIGMHVRKMHVRKTGTYDLGGIRVVCDGLATPRMSYVELSHQRLSSGDVRTHIRATDTKHRQWHGWMRDGYVTLRPYKARKARKRASDATVAT